MNPRRWLSALQRCACMDGPLKIPLARTETDPRGDLPSVLNGSQGKCAAPHVVTACMPCKIATRVLSTCTTAAVGQVHASGAPVVTHAYPRRPTVSGTNGERRRDTSQTDRQVNFGLGPAADVGSPGRAVLHSDESTRNGDIYDRNPPVSTVPRVSFVIGRRRDIP